jgi:hypothetical protein
MFPEPVAVETVVTRTERHVYHAKDANGGGGPVADERTVTTVYVGDQELGDQSTVVERSALPLSVEEAQHWEQQKVEPYNADEDRLFTNSREAMIIDGEERRLDDGDGFVRTTTLVTQHAVPEYHEPEPLIQEDRVPFDEEELKFSPEVQQREDFGSPSRPQRESSPESSGM